MRVPRASFWGFGARRPRLGHAWSRRNHDSPRRNTTHDPGKKSHCEPSTEMYPVLVNVYDGYSTSARSRVFTNVSTLDQIPSSVLAIFDCRRKKGMSKNYQNHLETRTHPFAPSHAPVIHDRHIDRVSARPNDLFCILVVHEKQLPFPLYFHENASLSSLQNDPDATANDR